MQRDCTGKWREKMYGSSDLLDEETIDVEGRYEPELYTTHVMRVNLGVHWICPVKLEVT